MGNGRRPLALLAVTILTGCGQREVEDAPAPGPATVTAPAPPAAATTPAPVAAPARDPYDEIPLDHLPPLESVPPGPQRLLETARRALLQGRAELDKKQFALATEDFDVAAEALRAARRDLSEGPTTAEIDQLLAQFKRELPGSPAEVDALINRVSHLRGPIQPAPTYSAAPPTPPAAEPAPAPESVPPAATPMERM